MELKDRFQVVYVDDRRVVYTVNREGPPGEFRISWVASFDEAHCATTYSEFSVREHLENGNWEIVPEFMNGFSRNGTPLNFTRADLKPGMRVNIKNGGWYIAMPSNQFYDNQGVQRGQIMLAGDGCWVAGRFETDSDNERYEPHRIVAVYEQPEDNYLALHVNVTGPLLWSEKDPTEQEREKKAQALKEELVLLASDVCDANARMEQIKNELETL